VITLRKAVALGLCYVWPVSSILAQQAAIEPQRPSAPVLWRPYAAAQVPPVRVANSGRLRELVRAGRLYLTVQDAIALALEKQHRSRDSALWTVHVDVAGGARRSGWGFAGRA